MLALTRTAVRTRIRELLAEPTERHFTDDAINLWISDGVRDVSIKTFCNTEIITTGIATTSGITTYVWPSDIDGSSIATLGIKGIVLTTNVTLDYISPEQIGRAGSLGVQNMKWTTWGENIVLSHAPSATMTLIPYIWIVNDQTGASTIQLPTAYQHTVILYGVAMGHIKRLELEAANYIYGMYQQEMDRITSLIRAHYVPIPMKQGVHNQGETP